MYYSVKYIISCNLDIAFQPFTNVFKERSKGQQTRHFFLLINVRPSATTGCLKGILASYTSYNATWIPRSIHLQMLKEGSEGQQTRWFLSFQGGLNSHSEDTSYVRIRQKYLLTLNHAIRTGDCEKNRRQSNALDATWIWSSSTVLSYLIVV